MAFSYFASYSLNDIIFEGRNQAYGTIASHQASLLHVVKATAYIVWQDVFIFGANPHWPTIPI